MGRIALIGGVVGAAIGGAVGHANAGIEIGVLLSAVPVWFVGKRLKRSEKCVRARR